VARTITSVDDVYRTRGVSTLPRYRDDLPPVKTVKRWAAEAREELDEVRDSPEHRSSLAYLLAGTPRRVDHPEVRKLHDFLLGCGDLALDRLEAIVASYQGDDWEEKDHARGLYLVLIAGSVPGGLKAAAGGDLAGFAAMAMRVGALGALAGLEDLASAGVGNKKGGANSTKKTVALAQSAIRALLRLNDPPKTTATGCADRIKARHQGPAFPFQFPIEKSGDEWVVYWDKESKRFRFALLNSWKKWRDTREGTPWEHELADRTFRKHFNEAASGM
jgi:hypothetical protein